MTTKKTTEQPQKREAWGRLRKLPSKRWQARYTGPDEKTYSARTEDDKPLTFLTKTDARAWLNRMHETIASGRWEPPAEAVRRRRAEAEAAAIRDVTFRDYAEQWLQRITHEPGKGGRRRRPGTVTSYGGASRTTSSNRSVTSRFVTSTPTGCGRSRPSSQRCPRC